MIQDHKVSVFYTAPTAIRSLIKAAEANEAVHPQQLRPGEPAHPRFGRRADQPGRLGVVPPARRRRPLPDRRHLLADRDRRPHDHAAARRDAAGAGLLHAAVPGHRRPRSSTRPATTCPNGQGGILVVKKPWPGMIRTIWGDPERFKKSYYPEELKGATTWPATARSATRRPATSPSPAASTTCSTSSGHRMGTMEIESALVSSTDAGGRGRRRRPPRRHDGRGDLRLRRAEAPAPDRRRSQEDRQRVARLGRQGDRPDRQAEGHPLRRQPAEDAQRQDHAAPAALDRQGRGDHAGHSTLENPAILDQLGQPY